MSSSYSQSGLPTGSFHCQIRVNLAEKYCLAVKYSFGSKYIIWHYLLKFGIIETAHAVSNNLYAIDVFSHNFTPVYPGTYGSRPTKDTTRTINLMFLFSFCCCIIPKINCSDFQKKVP